MVAHIPIQDTNEQEKQINTVDVTSSVLFSFDSALQALCKSRISCTHSQTRTESSQQNRHRNTLKVLGEERCITSRRFSFSTARDRTSCWISGSLCKIQTTNQIKPQGQEGTRTCSYSTEIFGFFRSQDHPDDNEVDLFGQYAFCGFVLKIPLCVHPPPRPSPFQTQTDI